MDIQKIKNNKSIKELMEFSIINLDKPSSLTSFQTTFEIKKILGLNKTGHFGTLDSGVTGVLPIALNKACKLSGYFMKKDKEYIGEMHLHDEISEEKLKEEIKKFIGKIKQMPPVRSAVKRVERERIVNKFEIIKLNGKDIDFHADVEAGTYIRKLIHDIGEKIGGAHMTKLKRIRAGIFNEKDSCNLDELKKAFEEYKNGNEKLLRKILIPGEIIIEIIPFIFVKEEFKTKFENGSPLFKDMLKYDEDFERLGKLEEGKHIALFIEDKIIEIARISKKGNRIAMPDVVI